MCRLSLVYRSILSRPIRLAGSEPHLFTQYQQPTLHIVWHVAQVVRREQTQHPMDLEYVHSMGHKQ